MTPIRKIIIAGFGIAWVFLALHPVSRVDWLVENIPIFALLVVLLV